MLIPKMIVPNPDHPLPEHALQVKRMPIHSGEGEYVISHIAAGRVKNQNVVFRIFVNGYDQTPIAVSGRLNMLLPEAEGGYVVYIYAFPAEAEFGYKPQTPEVPLPPLAPKSLAESD